jgi:hypothetical protein
MAARVKGATQSDWKTLAASDENVVRLLAAKALQATVTRRRYQGLGILAGKTWVLTDLLSGVSIRQDVERG